MNSDRPQAEQRRRGLKTIRLVQCLAVAALAAGIGGLALSRGAGAQEHDATSTTTTTPSNPNTYNVSAQANGLDVLVTDPSLPVSSLLTIEAGPFGASAALNSLGGSISDAGAPYSPAVSSLPGTIAGLGTGVIPPLPPLPGYVSANYPGTPTNKQTQGGYQISASASPSDAEGSVAIGVQPVGSGNATMFASAEATANSDGSVKVSASAGLDGLSFGQLFDLANVSSSVSLVQGTSGTPVVKSQTNLGTVTLLGQMSGLTTSGLSVLGLNVPIDINHEIIGTLNSVLSPFGVRLSYVPETIGYTDGTMSTGSQVDPAKTLQSIDSGALRVTVTRALASQGTLTATFTVGRVFVTTTDTPGFGTAEDTGSEAGGGDIATTPTAPALLGSDAGPTFAAQPSAPPTTAGSPSSPTTPRAVAAQPAYALEKGPSAESLYLMLILVALVVLLGSQALRFFSVRLALLQTKGV